MFSSHRLDSPPPISQFRRPWSPLNFESTRNGAQRQDRISSESSFEALELVEYQARFPQTRQAEPMHNQVYHSSYPPEHFPEYPATPPRSFSLASRSSYPSPPSLVSAGSSSAQSHSRSGRSHTPSRRPFSLPTPTPRYPFTPPGSNSGHSHNVPRIFEAQSPPVTSQPEVDISSFPEWSRGWYDRPKPQMPGAFDPYDTFNPYDAEFSPQSHDGFGFGYPAKPLSSVNDSHRSLLPWSGEDDAPRTHVTSEMKEDRLRMLEKEFGQNGQPYFEGDESKVIGSVDSKGNIITDGPKKRVITRWVQFTFVLGTIIASYYSALVSKMFSLPQSIP